MQPHPPECFTQNIAAIPSWRPPPDLPPRDAENIWTGLLPPSEPHADRRLRARVPHGIKGTRLHSLKRIAGLNNTAAATRIPLGPYRW